MSFWNERWCTEVSLRELFPNIFVLAKDRNASTGQLWYHNRWNLELRIHAEATVQLQVTKLKKLIQGHPQVLMKMIKLFEDG